MSSTTDTPREFGLLLFAGKIWKNITINGAKVGIGFFDMLGPRISKL